MNDLKISVSPHSTLGEVQTKPKKLKQKTLLQLATLSSGILIFAFALFLIKYVDLQKNYQEVKGLADNNTQVSKEQEAKEIIEKFNQIVDFKEEEPTVATILDIERLKKENEIFYKNALNGDKLIIFTGKKLAFIYRESDNKIINIAPINVSPDSTKPIK